MLHRAKNHTYGINKFNKFYIVSVRSALPLQSCTFTFQSGFSPFLNFTSPLHFLSATLSLTPSFPPPIENSTLQIYQHKQAWQTLLATCRQQDALALTRYSYLFVGALGLTVSGWLEVWSSSSFGMRRWRTNFLRPGLAYRPTRNCLFIVLCACVDVHAESCTCWVIQWVTSHNIYVGLSFWGDVVNWLFMYMLSHVLYDFSCICWVMYMLGNVL